ncbi:unnamed protein product, partial [Owenia fusiformis]
VILITMSHVCGTLCVCSENMHYINCERQSICSDLEEILRRGVIGGNCALGSTPSAVAESGEVTGLYTIPLVIVGVFTFVVLVAALCLYCVWRVGMICKNRVQAPYTRAPPSETLGVAFELDGTQEERQAIADFVGASSDEEVVFDVSSV